MLLSDLSEKNYNYLLNELNKENSWVLYQTGDILKRPDINILIHQTNCFNIFESDISKKIKENYPNVFLADKNTKNGDKNKLGSFSVSLEKNINTGNELVIFNLYTIYNSSANINNEDNSIQQLFNLKNCLITLADFIKLHQMEHEKYQIIIGVPWPFINIPSSANQIFNLFKNIFEPLKQYTKILFVDNEK